LFLDFGVAILANNVALIGFDQYGSPRPVCQIAHVEAEFFGSSIPVVKSQGPQAFLITTFSTPASLEA
jgi:hypothetical protein